MFFTYLTPDIHEFNCHILSNKNMVVIVNTKNISDLIGWEQQHKSHISYFSCFDVRTRKIWPRFIFRGLVSEGAKWMHWKADCRDSWYHCSCSAHDKVAQTLIITAKNHTFQNFYKHLSERKKEKNTLRETLLFGSHYTALFTF